LPYLDARFIWKYTKILTAVYVWSVYLLKQEYLSPGQEKIIFFLGAQPGDKNFLQTNGVFLY
jgi:hypothetical protein